ncbi:MULTISPECIES: hypothetical protein [unclassified Streptomyces]|uniref:hypothetical protein n=1 Tax=unclassified Streptomyces TaxID=2593676 RepID=UPI002E2C28FB|nr:hypothetical protein [Streptomyces sp. NBC_00223]
MTSHRPRPTNPAPDAAVRKRRARLFAGAVAAAVLTAPLTACQPKSQFTIHNNTHERLVISHLVLDRPGAEPIRYPGGSIPPGKANIWAIRLGSDGDCATQYQLIATAPSGRTYTYGPPVCTGGSWTITDTPAPTGT